MTTHYTRKELDDIARDIIKTLKKELPPAYRHCPRLAEWTLVVEGVCVTLAVLIDDHTGRRQVNVAI